MVASLGQQALLLITCKMYTLTLKYHHWRASMQSYCKAKNSFNTEALYISTIVSYNPCMHLDLHVHSLEKLPEVRVPIIVHLLPKGVYAIEVLLPCIKC